MNRQYVIPFSKISKRSTFQLTSNLAGSLLVVLNPYGMCATRIIGTPVDTAKTIPWLSICQSTTNQLYTPGSSYDGPFLATAPQISAGFPDISNIRFVSSMAPIQASGILTSTVFY